MRTKFQGFVEGEIAEGQEEQEPAPGNPDDEVERALLELATGYTRTAYKARRRQGKVTLAPVERIFAPNALARAIVAQQRLGGRSLLRKLDKAKRGKR
jgi:hypothetical protein